MGDWTENIYTETRFGGMDSSAEPHTLDRDSGVMADEFNMLSRTQGLRTRKGWALANDLTLYVSSVPGELKSPTGLIGYKDNLATVPEDEDEEEADDSGGVIGGLEFDDDDTGVSTHGKDDPAAVVAMSIPETVVAECGFTVAVTASGKFGGDGARLSWTLAPGQKTANVTLSRAIRSGWENNAWTATATIQTVDRSCGTVKAALMKRDGMKASREAAYAVASMIPEFSSETIVYMQQFGFTVSAKNAGSVCTSYSGKGKGVSISWKAFDGNGNSVPCKVRASSGEWESGVGTFTGTLVSVSPSAATIRISVEYAGQTQTDTAALDSQPSISLPETLHVFGPAAMMTVNAGSYTRSGVSIAAYSGGTQVELGNYLEMEDGAPLDFGEGKWENDTWSHKVRAKSGGFAETLTVKLMAGDVQKASGTIGILDEISAAIDAPDSIVVGGTLNVTATISAVDASISRIPSETAELQATGCGLVEYEDNEEDSFEITGSWISSSSGTILLQVLDLRDESVIAQKTVSVISARAALAEAINERFHAKGDTSAEYKESDTLSVLWGAALGAMKDFANGDVASDGTYTAYSNTAESTGIPDPSASGTVESEWIQNAYDKVCTAVAKGTNAYSMRRMEKTGAGSYQYPTRWNQETHEYEESGTEAGAKNLAEEAWRSSRQEGQWVSSSSFGAYHRGSTSHAYLAWGAQCATKVYAFGAKLDAASSIPRSAGFYFKATKYSGNYNYDNLGHHNLAENQTGMLLSSECAANAVPQWADKDIGHPEGISWGNSGGYTLTINSCIITYGFKHVSVA